MNTAQLVESVRDDPEGRYQLRVAFYKKYGFAKDSGAGYGTSELAFLRWEIERGVLNPVAAAQPGSPGTERHPFGGRGCPDVAGGEPVGRTLP